MEKQFGVLGIQLNKRENGQRSERCLLQHECHFLMLMRCFLTSSTRTHICNEAAKEDYCTTQFYFIVAFFTRLLQTAIRNSWAAEAVLGECSRIVIFYWPGEKDKLLNLRQTGELGLPERMPRRSILLFACVNCSIFTTARDLSNTTVFDCDP